MYLRSLCSQWRGNQYNLDIYKVDLLDSWPDLRIRPGDDIHVTYHSLSSLGFDSTVLKNDSTVPNRTEKKGRGKVLMLGGKVV